MIDFLRSNTWCSREEYLWELTVPQVQLSSIDFSHVNYNKRKSDRKHGHKRTKSISTGDMLKNMTDNGTPILR